MMRNDDQECLPLADMLMANLPARNHLSFLSSVKCKGKCKA